MITTNTTREITVNDEIIAAGTPVLAAYNAKTDRTTIVVRGIGRKSFKTAPVAL